MILNEVGHKKPFLGIVKKHLTRKGNLCYNILGSLEPLGYTITGVIFQKQAFEKAPRRGAVAFSFAGESIIFLLSPDIPGGR